MDASTYEQLCDEKFRFLIAEYAFEKGEVVGIVRLWSVAYSSATTRVGVKYEPWEAEIDVTIYPINTSDGRDDSSNFWYSRFRLQNLLDFLGVQKMLSPRGSGQMLSDEEIVKALDDSAHALRTYASDILKGDFGILPQIQAFIRSRG